MKENMTTSNDLKNKGLDKNLKKKTKKSKKKHQNRIKFHKFRIKFVEILRHQVFGRLAIDNHMR